MRAVTDIETREERYQNAMLRKYLLYRGIITRNYNKKRWWMRIEKHQKCRICFAFSICIILFFSIFSSLSALAQEEETLFIVIHDSETNLPIEENIFLEGKKYDIAIGCEGQYGYVYNVTVGVPWADPFITSEELPWITIETPDFGEYPEFVITALKDGYVPAEQEIKVLKGELSITTDRGTIKEKESFSVTVWDQNNNRVEGSTVYLDIDGSEGDSDNTGSNGIAYLTAPEVTDDVEIDIKAFKGGYFAGSNTIRVENVPESMFMDGLTPIIAAVLVLMLAMLFVRIRKERPKPTIESKADIPKKSIGDKKENLAGRANPRETPSKAKEELPSLEKGPWVEEIRIHRPEKKKETKYVIGEAEKIISSHKMDEDEWFKGKDHIRYKIDELTGEIDEQNEDKWFEGLHDVKSKVNKKLKKNCKKKGKSK